MKILSLLRDCFTKDYCKFSGRMGRFDFWVVAIIAIVVNLICYAFIKQLHIPRYAWFLIGGYEFLPILGALIRRSHDVGFSGKLVVQNLGFIMITLGFYYQYRADTQNYWHYCFFASLALALLYLIINIVVMCMKGKSKTNRYGIPPHLGIQKNKPPLKKAAVNFWLKFRVKKL